jgi:SAM-dependent methyltransferase
MHNQPSNPPDSREIWDARYEHARQAGGSGLAYDPWLERWQTLLPPGGNVLDLGCGTGQDSGWLRHSGCKVTAGDFSPAALQAAQAAGTPACFVQLDLRQGLPFAAGVFGAVVANLCLHYFPWPETLAMLRQIHGCLGPGGALLARFNSTRDTNHGAQGSPPIDPNAYLVGGQYKRFFDRASLEQLFAQGWQVLGLEELTIHRYQQPKVLWEVVARKA